MFDDAADQFGEMSGGAEAASRAFAKLRQEAAALLSALDRTENGAAGIENVAGAVGLLQSILRLTAESAGLLSQSSDQANQSLTGMSGAGAELVGVLQQIAAAVQSSGLGALAANADKTAAAFTAQKQAMADNSSSLGGLVMETILYISTAAAVYDVLKIVDGLLGGQSLKWGHLGDMIGAAGQKAAAAGGGISGLSAILGSVSERIVAAASAAGVGSAGITGFAAASRLAGAGMRSLISVTGSVITGFVGIVNSALASGTAMTFASTAGSMLGRSFKAVSLTAIGFGGALSGLLGLLKSLPRLLMLSAVAVRAFIVAAAPVLIPLALIAAAIMAIIAAWKALKAMFNLGGALIKTFATYAWEAAKAAYALGKELAGYLYNGLVLLAKGLKAVISLLIDLYRSARDALIGALDRLAGALYVVIPALKDVADALGNAADKVGEFFSRIRRDANGAANTIFRMSQVFGQNASDAMQWAQSYSRGVGRAFTDTANEVLSFTREFMKLNIAAESARKLSQSMTQLGNDIASALNVSPAGVMDALTAAIGGNTDALYAYGIAIDAVDVKQKLLAKGMNPEKTTAAQKALATLAVVADKSAFAYDHLANNTQRYHNQQLTLNAEVQETSELLGGILAQAHSKLTAIMIGGLRVVRQWIAAHREFVAKFVDLPEILTGASMAFRVLAVACSVMAGALLAVSSVLSLMLSPLGMISREIVRQSGLLEKMRDVYENAFGGAIKKMVETALAARVAGVTIGNWFSIGFLTAKQVAYQALAAIIGKFQDLLKALPEMIRSFSGMEVFGSRIGAAVEMGILLAKKSFFEFGAAAGGVFNTLMDGALGMYEVIRTLAAWIQKAISGYKLLTDAKNMSGEEVSRHTANFAADVGATVGKEMQKLRGALANPVDVGAAAEKASAAEAEIEALKNGTQEAGAALTEEIAGAAETAGNAVQGILGRAREGMSGAADELKAQVESLKNPQNPSNQNGGIELDKEAADLFQKIQEAANNNPLVEGFKNLFDEVLPQLQAELQPKASAQGTFTGQLQAESVSVQKQQLTYLRQTADNTKRLLETGGLAVAGG